MPDGFGASLSPFAELWPLDPSVAYLNHGSFGACPRAVVEFQAELRRELEREPVDFLVRRLPGRLAAAREALGRFVAADPGDLAFVPNATTAVNTVLRGLRPEPGDELLTTDHAYAACRKALDHVARLARATVVVASVPFPLQSEDEIVEPVLAAATPRTRLALVDHVTSVTGLVFPITRLVAALEARGIQTLVDGAHAPGMVALDLDGLGASYYAANAHKWLCAPKGAAFLHVRRDRQRGLHPLVISHGYDAAQPDGDFRAEFDWTGTVDPTAWLAIPECLRFVGTLLSGGWPGLMARNRALVLQARATLCEALGTEPPCPDAMVGSMASVLLPAADPSSPAARLDVEPLTDWFRQRGIETWLHPWPGPGRWLIRASAQLYNSREQYRVLAQVAREALGAA